MKKTRPKEATPDPTAERVREHLKELKLPTMRDHFEAQAERDRRGHELPAVPGGADGPRVRGANAGPDPAPDARLAAVGGQDAGRVRVVARATGGGAPVPGPARRLVPGLARERVGVREAGLREDAHAVRRGSSWCGAGGRCGSRRAACWSSGAATKSCNKLVGCVRRTSSASGYWSMSTRMDAHRAGCTPTRRWTRDR